MIQEFQHYFKKAQMKQEQLYEGGSWTNEDINDDLINNVPIYDVVNRRYAAFSSLPEALRYKGLDPKGNGYYFQDIDLNDYDFVVLLYLFRLCGSGINYKPKDTTPWGSHGFGNFWIVNLLREGITNHSEWIDKVPDKGFSNNKGYIIPQFKKKLRNYIQDDSLDLIGWIWYMINECDLEIFEIADIGNEWLIEKGFRRQNFVLTAFAMDLAEYFPTLVDPKSRVKVGSNAKKCLQQIFPYRRGIGTNLDVTNEALDELIHLTGNKNNKMDMEDVCCDFIRYIDNFQSLDHVKKNNGQMYTNSLGKRLLREEAWDRNVDL